MASYRKFSTIFLFILLNDRNITHEGNSSTSDNVIQLTTNSIGGELQSSVGRATYMDDVLLWDSTTGRVTDFETHFSFIMLAVDNLSYGDGITFFLAPKWSKLPPDSHGGYLGLLSKDKATDNSTQNQIVSVEFDSWRNDWDPSPDNVGINVNSVVSVANVTWKSSIKDGRKGNAWVSYNSTTKNLSVFLTYADNPVFRGNSSLFHIVDLSKFLPEWIRFSKLRHRNLVQLVGWSHERDELLLVYEFMPNGSLDNHLFRGEADLTWEVRYKIALGLASALLYLHEDWEQCVVHRDIKSSNVMLDSNFNAKLGDFGLARLVDHKLGSQTTVLAGTFGYLAPDHKSLMKPYEADVGFSLVEWVWGLYGGGKIVEAADERLRMDFNELEMEQLMVVGLWCAHLDSKSRPSETQVLNVLKFESPLPKLPLELPIPVYLPALPFAPDLPSFAGFTDTLTPR
ncbi:hypothetical protein C5167_039980 [Papaver somniferum]|uniref:non-specific serine/threonine protein kinase n=1 Tax=Papaver somniferum TaxID=3469 RepID=A0A4Y7IH34_PAPSO|nr:hypothetical protein C5167_039980 [Papaver somniferum]